MRLSILDQAPISPGQTAREALEQSVLLAQTAESLGYTRFWMAEHHNIPGLACPAPEVMLPYIGARTSKIRIGSGAILLPHYKPYKVAELFNLLATLFPDRIDVGIGRAPGGSAEVTNALSDNFLQNVWKLPESLKDLLHFIHNDHPKDSELSKIKAAPLPDVSPQPWLLGTAKKSALLAAEYGMAYAFGLFMSDKDPQDILQAYYDSFKQGSTETPQTILTVSAICAETAEQADEIASSSLIWNLQQESGEVLSSVHSVKAANAYELPEKAKEAFEKMKRKMIIGNPKQVKDQLLNIYHRYNPDEIMILTITYSPEDRLKSYELIAGELL